MGAARELIDLYTHLGTAQTELVIDKFYADQGIQWSFPPEYTARFDRLWEAAMKILKCHFQCIDGDICLTFKELATILAQVEACQNSRTLTPLPNRKMGLRF